MLSMKRAFPDRRVDERHEWMCARGAIELAAYSGLGHDGMPHGFPALSDARHRTVMDWLRSGANLPRDTELTPDRA